eukprot:TRINITY_DN18247_c0_g1_i1.p1 TRINITY_DN18247_c0_g1~~TRINITY_DN18247_c0_g1_i1.p1  ORF type:complete len:433 (+),score=76.17 TRINITY_DN18247_c0_g1_i1:96-1394(+)
MPPSLLKPPPQISSRISISPFSLANSHFPIYIINPPKTTKTLTFSKRRLTSLSLSSSSTSFSNSFQEEFEEEHVIGDCVVFEEGIFEDPFLRDDDVDDEEPVKKKFETDSLVPEEYKQAQAEINLTKKEKRKMAQQLEFGSRVGKKKFRLPDMEEYLTYRAHKLSQLNPVALEDPRYPLKEVTNSNRDVGDSGDGELGSSSSGRVMPRNPRLGVYGGTLEDIAEVFNSSNYQPGENDDKKSQGPRKLFTKEEKILLNKRIPNLADATSRKWLPLHSLAASGEFYLVNMLLKHNVDINAADKDGLTALHKAILCKKQAITNYLLRESANPFVQDKDGATLMHYAVQAASSQTIKILLLYNVDINLCDYDGWTPLHLAVQTQRTDLVRLLLIKGADKTLKNRDGLTPLDLCLYSGRDVRTYELIKLLKELPKSK